MITLPYGPENDFEGDPRSDDWHKISNDEYRKYCDMGADEFMLKAMPWLPLLLFESSIQSPDQQFIACQFTQNLQ